MRKAVLLSWASVGIRYLLGATFILAGVIKMQDIQSFGDTIAGFQLLPTAIINLIAIGLPPLELIVGIMLIMAWRMRAATFAGTILLTIFTVALFQALLRGLSMDCGCFGHSDFLKWTPEAELFRDGALLCGAAWLYSRAACNENPS